jgi:dipeptidyl aminopeptidase/acylaminoacyl peptidase
MSTALRCLPVVAAAIAALVAAPVRSAPIPTPARPVTAPKSVASPKAPPAAPPAIEALFRSAQSVDAEVTPDGRDLVYSANPTGRMNLWRVPLAGGTPVRLTTSNERQWGIAISPDSATVVYGQDFGGAEMFDLFAVARAGGEPVNLTNTPDASETGAVFSPDGRRLGYAQRLKTAPSANVVVMDLDSRRARVLTEEKEPDRQWSVVAFSGDGRTVYASRGNIMRTEATLYAIDVETHRATEVLTGTGSKMNVASDVTPDGRYVALTTETAGGAQQAALYDVGAKHLTLLAPSPWEQSTLRFAKDGRSLLFASNVDGRTVVSRYDLKAGRAVPVALPPGVNEAGNLPALTADGARIVFPHQSGNRSVDYYVADATGRDPKRITSLAQEAAVPETRIVTFPSFDGTLVSAVLWVPANAARDGHRPAVVIAHGGPTWQTSDRYDADAVALASRGYFVLAPNPRGSTGYGRAFQQANLKDLGGGDLKDYVAGTKFLVESGYVDPTRIGIMGTSYGGYMTMMAIGRSPDTFAAGAETCGITNWTSMYERGSPQLRYYQEGLIGHPERDREVYARTSPLTYLDRVKAPLLVIQGENDIRVPKYEAEQVAATLRKLGRTVDAKVYPEEGHGLSKRENQIDALERTVAWFDRYLKRAPAGSTD